MPERKSYVDLTTDDDGDDVPKLKSSIDLTVDDDGDDVSKQQSYIDLNVDDDRYDEYADSVPGQVYGNASHEDYQKERVGQGRPKHEAKHREQERRPDGNQGRKNGGRVGWKTSRGKRCILKTGRREIYDHRIRRTDGTII